MMLGREAGPMGLGKIKPKNMSHQKIINHSNVGTKYAKIIKNPMGNEWLDDFCIFWMGIK